MTASISLSHMKYGLKVALLCLLIAPLTACFDSDEKAIEPEFENLGPFASPLSVVTQTEVAISNALPGSDREGDAITFSALAEPANGIVQVDANGSFTYTPNKEFVGSDSFDYQVVDAQGRTAMATVSITIETLQVSFLEFSRDSFNAEPSAEPNTLNGKAFNQDALNQADYQDLIDAQQ